MEYIYSLQDISYWGNTLYDYALAVVLFVLTLVGLKIFQAVILARLRSLAKKTANDLDDALIEVFSDIKPAFYLIIAVYLGYSVLKFPALVDKVVLTIILILVVYEVIQALQKLIDYILTKYAARMDNGRSRGSKSMVKAAGVVIKIILWLFGIILVLSNLGIDVTSLLAGLGIGGIAIALAVQNILGDVFSSFMIYIDQPFKIGDFIIIGTDSGTVEKIGLKTTRIRTLQGEELIVSNQELSGARIQNFKRMKKRRVAVDLGVIYGTAEQKLKLIPQITEQIVRKQSAAEFDRCHFKTYGDFSLIYELVYHVDSPDYNQYMDVNQEINLAIYTAFKKAKIEFAYPTQTVIVQK